MTLALGIGANAAVLGLVDEVLLRPPPYDDPDELVLVWNTLPGSPDRVPVAGPDVAVIEERVRSLAAVGFTIRGVDGSVEAATGDAVQHVRVAAVTPDFFEVLGARAARGRVFDERDGPGAEGDGAPPAAAPAAILSHGLWQRAFGGDPAAVGRTVRVNGIAGTLVGVMPAGFRLHLPPAAGVATDVDLWVPLQVPLTAFHRTGDRLLDQDSDNSGAVVARLAPGASVAEARAELDRVARELRAEVPAYAAAGLGFDARPLHADATAHVRGILVLLLVGGGVVLLVACLNVATLTLARSVRRRRELSVRRALGAGRGALVRQLVVESGVLAALGTAAALGLAWAVGGVLGGLAPAALDVPVGTARRPLPILAGLSVGAVAVVLAGLAPALGSDVLRRRDGPAGALRRGARRSARARRLLVTAEVALSVVLVLGAGLLLRTVDALEDVRPGFEPEGALTFGISLRVPDRYRSPAVRARFMSDVEARIAALPGVGSVGLAGALPLSGDRWTQPYGLPGQAASEWRSNRADFRMVTSGYFRALGTRVLEGRTFTEREDVAEDERVVVVDERLAARIAPSGSALGASIGIPLDGRAVEARVVGVVENVRHETLETEGREAVYVPYRQEASRDVSFVLRTSGDPAALAPAVRRVVRELDPGVPVHDVRTLARYVDEAVAPRTFALRLLTGFALLALLCAAVGLYGVVAFEAARRTGDVGVRMALGATRREVVRDVLGDGLRMAAWGLGVGVVLAAAVARGLRSVVFGVGVADPPTWAAVLAVVTAVTLLACWLPARRAAGLDPSQALRRGPGAGAV